MSELKRLADKVIYGTHTPGVDDKALLNMIDDHLEYLSELRGMLVKVSKLRDGDMGEAVDWLASNTDDMISLIAATEPTK